jgi:hypothetical protein
MPITSAARGVQELAKHAVNNTRVFHDLGIEVRNADGSLRSTFDLLVDLAGVFEKSDDETAKLALSVRLLGESGRVMMPMLDAGAERIRKLGEEAETTGRKLDDDTIASLHRFDEMMKGLSDKWKGFTVSIRVGVVNAFTPGKDSERALVDAEIAAAKRMFPTRIGTGTTGEVLQAINNMGDLDRLRLMRQAEDDLAAATKAADEARAKSSAEATAKIQAAAKKADEAAQAARRFESELASLEQRLSSRDMSTEQIDRLASALNAGSASTRSLLVQLHTADAVMRVVDRARFMAEMVKAYGDNWVGADMLTRQHTDHLRTTEEKLRAVRQEMDKLLGGAKGVDSALQGIATLRLAPKSQLSPSGQVPNVPMATPQGGLASGSVWEWLGSQESANSGSSTAISAMERITAAVESNVDRWTQKLTIFRGFFGDVMQIILQEAVKTFTRMAALKLFETVLSAGGTGTAAAINQSGGAGIPYGPTLDAATQVVDGASAARSASPAVSRGTTIINVNALDLGTVNDRFNSPFGALRLALEAAQDAGR